MTSSISSSSRAQRAARGLVAGVALAALALAASGCAGPRRGGAAEPAVQRVALYPIDNASGAIVAVKELLPAIERALARRGFEVVTGDAVDQFLARRRIRNTAVVEGGDAQAAREELGVDGIVVTSLEAVVPGPPPRFALTMRLVSASADPEIAWIDAVSHTGDEAPGFLGLGMVDRLDVLEERSFARLARSLRAAVNGSGPAAPRCEKDDTFAVKIAFRAPQLTAAPSPRVAVLPFVNFARFGRAGDHVALALVRGLRPVERFRVLEPGVVRDLLLRFRIVLQGGVNLEQARSMLGALEADLVVTGDVFEYDDGGSPGSVRVNINLTVLDGRTGKIVWQSTSHNRGDDGEALFGAGTVRTAQEATCRMVRDAVDAMVRPMGPPPR